MANDNILQELDKNKFGVLFQVHREINGLSALETADKLDLKEDDIVEIEKGEAVITPEIVKKSSVLFKTDFISLLSSLSSVNHFENVYSSPINSNFHTYKSTDEKQSEAILLLIDNVTSMNKRITELLEQK
jgi:DNA-binding XRE family transcriptional regulator